jgi:hypothetical protein
VADIASEVATVPDVLTEIQSGSGLSLSAAGRLFPGHRGGNSVDPSTVFRWLTKGARTAVGQVVKLEAVRVGGRWLTSRGAVTRFVEALTSAATPNASLASPPFSSQSTATKRAAAAAAKLERMGA